MKRTDLELIKAAAEKSMEIDIARMKIKVALDWALSAHPTRIPELPNTYKLPDTSKMEEAIASGMQTHKNMPRLGSVEFLIKAEVAEWIWSQWHALKEEKDPELKALLFLQRITK